MLFISITRQSFFFFFIKGLVRTLYENLHDHYCSRIFIHLQIKLADSSNSLSKC